MAGRVSALRRQRAGGHIDLSPRNCPAGDRAPVDVACMVLHTSGMLTVCPMLYGTETLYEKRWTRNPDLNTAGVWLVDEEMPDHGCRVLCQLAKSADIHVGA